MLPNWYFPRQQERGRLITCIKNSVDGSCDERQCTTKNYGRNNRSAYWLKRQSYELGDEKKKPQKWARKRQSVAQSPVARAELYTFSFEFPKKSKVAI